MQRIRKIIWPSCWKGRESWPKPKPSSGRRWHSSSSRWGPITNSWQKPSAAWPSFWGGRAMWPRPKPCNATPWRWRNGCSERRARAAESRDRLAVLLAARGDLADAEAMLTNALAMTKKLAGTEHPDVISPLRHLSWVLKQTGRSGSGRNASPRSNDAKPEGWELQYQGVDRQQLRPRGSPSSSRQICRSGTAAPG